MRVVPPVKFSLCWTFLKLLRITIVVQLITAMVLALYYTIDINFAYTSIIYILHVNNIEISYNFIYTAMLIFFLTCAYHKKQYLLCTNVLMMITRVFYLILLLLPKLGSIWLCYLVIILNIPGIPCILLWSFITIIVIWIDPLLPFNRSSPFAYIKDFFKKISKRTRLFILIVKAEKILLNVHAFLICLPDMYKEKPGILLFVVVLVILFLISFITAFITREKAISVLPALIVISILTIYEIFTVSKVLAYETGCYQWFWEFWHNLFGTHSNTPPQRIIGNLNQPCRYHPDKMLVDFGPLPDQPVRRDRIKITDALTFPDDHDAISHRKVIPRQK